MAKKDIIEIHSITDIHRLLGIKAPEHPLLSVSYPNEFPKESCMEPGTYRNDLYVISLKTIASGQFNYGRGSYDFQDGTLICTGPGQVMSFDKDQLEQDRGHEGWTLMFHPDLLRRSSIAQSISGYSFFDYEANEALHLSDKEKAMLLELVRNIEREISQNMDRHSQDLILINLESILKYTSRYYDRQFYTRSDESKGHLQRFERFLKDYFNSNELSEKGLPSIDRCGQALNMSGHYLSDLLKAETGKSAREHIHLQLVDRAKNLLLGSNATVSEIAYDLGFDYPQHFSKLFKTKTGLSPSEYRSLN
ncbi:MAG: AraC family transcriptional regulator [Flavobacteriales bacterium]|nr:AraC family transcriptional regulator [Flavobacteriales bacterium]